MIRAPDGLNQRLPGYTPPGPARQACEQQELKPREVDVLEIARHRSPNRIDYNIVDPDRSVAFFAMTPRDGLQPRNQFRKREGLGKVVVRACVEAVNDLILRVASGQHQHWCHSGPFPQGMHQCIPIQLRQPDIQHDGVEFMRRGDLQPRLAIPSRHNGKAVLIEPLAQ